MKAADTTAAEKLAGALGYTFRDLSLLGVALTHRSAAYEMTRGRRGDPARDNERMEFLGDAVLAMTVTDILWAHYPDATEGELTRLRAALVNEGNLARVSTDLGIGDAVRLGRGEDRSGGRARPALLADTLEAVLAAVYLDGGFEAARGVVGRLLGSSLDSIRLRGTRDSKSILQEMLQGSHGVTPRYDLKATHGPDHQRVFVVEMLAGDHLRTQGEGRTKKLAEQDAASKALMQVASGLVPMAAPTGSAEGPPSRPMRS